MANSVPLVMGIREAAQYLGLTENWVRQSCIDGTLPAQMVRGRWVIRRPELDAWLAGQEPGTGPAPRREVNFKPSRGRRRAA